VLNEWLSDLRYRARAVFRRDQLERELDEELRYHLDREAEKHRLTGITPAEAARRARVTFGGFNRIKDDSREARGVFLFDVLRQDLRYAWRGLLARPGFTSAVVLALGLGLGANAAIFGVVDRLMFRPAPFLHHPSRVHRVYLTRNERGTDVTDFNFEYTRYLDFRRWTHTFDRAAAWQVSTIAVGTGENAREMRVGAVSASFFDFFDARPVAGRFFGEDEDHVPVGDPVAVLSWAFWQTRYGGRLDALGGTLRVGTVLCTIIGVAPRGFVGATIGDNPVAFIPITSYAGARLTKDPSDYYTTYNWGWLEMLVRRAPGVSIDAATADLTEAYRRSYQAEHQGRASATPIAIARPRATAGPVQIPRGPAAGNDARVITWISGVAVIVLLIACANVANLLLARAIRRRREVAVRLALGVSRGRLTSQLLTESALLALLGGVAGLVIAQTGDRALQSLFLPGDPSPSVLTDPRTLAFVVVMVAVSTLLTGLVPLLQSRSADFATSLKVREGTYHRSRTRTALLVFQAALSFVLLIGAGLFVRSLWSARSLPLGYDVEPVLYISTSMRGAKLTAEERLALKERMTETARRVVGVTVVARGLTVPFWDTWTTDLFVAGIDSVRRLGRFTLQAASSRFFEATGTRLVRGRGIQETDRTGAPLVAVVTESMARTLWPGRDAIGQCMRVDADTLPCTTIVGVSEDVKQNSLTSDLGLHYFLSIDQFHPEEAVLFVRVSGDARRFAEPVRKALQQVMPGASYVTVTPMHDIVDPNRRSWYLGATMFVAFGLLSVVLAAIGLYSVIAHNVAQRTQELGVRVALGASAGNVAGLVVGEGLRFACIGLALGGALALSASPWLGPLLFHVSPRDPVVYIAVGLILIVVALVASATPAFRASRVDPMQALRAD
jgi:predicted permease